MTKLKLKSYSDSWEKDYFLTNSGKRIDFHKYVIDVIVNDQYSDFQIEISSFRKSMNVTILEHMDLSEHGYDIDEIEIKTIIVSRDKAYFDDFPTKKRAFIHLLKKGKKMLLNYLEN